MSVRTTSTVPTLTTMLYRYVIQCHRKARRFPALLLFTNNNGKKCWSSFVKKWNTCEALTLRVSLATPPALIETGIIQKKLLSNQTPINYDTQCWKCHKTRSPNKDIFFCFCGAILSPSKNLTYFKLLGLEEGFEIDSDILTRRYKDLQRILHPDKFSQKSEMERTFSAEQSSLVNLAYTTLLKPLSRGQYLLDINGCSLDETTQCDDFDFLSNIMRTNEDLENVINVEELRIIEDLNIRNLNQCYEILSEAFRQKDLVGAKEVLMKLKYFVNIDDKIKEMELYESL
ncbi:iron-sulfur cluster co-chaperone protein HscB [Octopus sinensis]|uniref:Iron-sulfur cluster co-chaperone protein HscB n=1 Tax=Octopus sinensis TaxID=2607531 RepID=A0A6P7S790_9MOLL|nr:iron-sulfur cluster co-chaperone protein HscB [Octopus sinensis]